MDKKQTNKQKKQTNNNNKQTKNNNKQTKKTTNKKQLECQVFWTRLGSFGQLVLNLGNSYVKRYWN